jgi:hypothetical protein
MEYKYRKEIAKEYGFTVKTLNRKLKSVSLLIGRGLLSPSQQKQIYDQLGYPKGEDPNGYKKKNEPPKGE